MLNKFLSSKFIQKLKTVKHIEIIIVVLFILLLLAIYFVNFDDKKKYNNENVILSSNDISSSIFDQVSEGFINITQNYKSSIENNIKNLIFQSTKENVEVYVGVLGGEVFYNFNDSKETHFSNESGTITVSGGVVSVNYTPPIDKVIITGTHSINVESKIKILEIVKSYLNISQNKIFMY